MNWKEAIFFVSIAVSLGFYGHQISSLRELVADLQRIVERQTAELQSAKWKISNMRLWVTELQNSQGETKKLTEMLTEKYVELVKTLQTLEDSLRDHQYKRGGPGYPSLFSILFTAAKSLLERFFPAAKLLLN